MCIIVSAIGNGNPYTLRMYLLNRITTPEREIHTPMYVYVSSAFEITLDAAASLMAVAVVDIQLTVDRVLETRSSPSSRHVTSGHVRSRHVRSNGFGMARLVSFFLVSF